MVTWGKRHFWRFSYLQGSLNYPFWWESNNTRVHGPWQFWGISLITIHCLGWCHIMHKLNQHSSIALFLGSDGFFNIFQLLTINPLYLEVPLSFPVYHISFFLAFLLFASLGNKVVEIRTNLVLSGDALKSCPLFYHSWLGNRRNKACTRMYWLLTSIFRWSTIQSTKSHMTQTQFMLVSIQHFRWHWCINKAA